MKGKYLYGIVKKTKDTSEVARRSLDSSDGGGITTVDFRSLSAVVAETERKDYHLLPKEEVVKELTKHQQTIEKIMEDFGTILPVKFGTILKDEGEVESVLAKGYSFLEDTLQKMEDKIELDLVCFWNEQKAAQRAYQESKRVQNWQKTLIEKGKTTLEDKIALGKLVADYLASKKEKISSLTLKVLKKEVVESCRHDLVEVNMLLNQAFLVEQEREEVFNRALNQLDSKFADLINFRLVGPLPPYSFATVVVESLDKEKIKSAKKLLKLNGELSKEKIKHAFNQLARRLHPDKGGDPLTFEFVDKGYKLLRKYAEQGLLGVYLFKWEEQPS